MKHSERVHCQFCDQDFISNNFDKCSLCGKTGGILRPGQVPMEERGTTTAPPTKPIFSSVEKIEEVASPAIPADPQLGNAIISCRRLGGSRTMQAQGFMFGWLLHYILFPLICMPYMALMTAMMSMFLLGYHQIEDMAKSMVLPLFVGFYYVLFMWLGYFRPRGDHLILFEKGIKARIRFQYLVLPFDSIQSIWQGRIPSRIERALRGFLSIFKPGQVNWLRWTDDTALTIYLKDGTEHQLKTVATYFEGQDLERFFQELLVRNPHLGLPPDGGQPQIPGQANKNSMSWRSFLFSPWLGFLVVFSLLIAMSISQNDRPSSPRSMVQTRQYRVEAEKLQHLAVPINQGDFLDVGVKVTSGDPVSIHICKGVKEEGKNKMILQGAAGFPPVTQVMNYQQKEKWQYSTPALIVLTTQGTADVSIRTETFPPK
jgi:hypothetical protein